MCWLPVVIVCAFSIFILNEQNLVFIVPVQYITSIGCSDDKFFVCIHQAVHVGWKLLAIKASLPDKTIGRIWDHWPW